MNLRWPDGPVAMPWPRSKRTVRHQRNRGHRAVENANHYRRDASLGEDASRLRARHAPANNATLNNIALAIVFHRGFRHVPEAGLHFMMRREGALDAILSPT